MAVKIHLAVKDANDIYAIINQPIEKYMRTDRVLAVAFPDIIAVSPERWRFCHKVDRISDPAKIPLGLIHIPGACGVTPDPIKVVPSTRRKDEASHLAAWALLRFSAMNASKSKGADVPLFSPSMSAACNDFKLASRSSSSLRPARTTSLADE
jgi:hypothetical protein